MPATMNISLPSELKAFVDQQVAERGFSSTSEYLRDLIRKQRDVDNLRRLLLDGADSPVVGVMDDVWFASLSERSRLRSSGE